MPESHSRPLRVFLCHSSKDQPIARELYRRLKTEYWLDVWFLEANLLPSQNWDVEIQRAVQSSDVLVVLQSRNAIDEGENPYPSLTFVLKILRRKPKREIPMMVLRLDDHLLPMSRNKTHTIDYFPKRRRISVYQNLIDRLQFHARQLHILLTGELIQTAADQFLQWSPSNWRNLTINNEADVFDDSSSGGSEHDSSQKMERRKFDRTNKLGVILWTIIGLLALLILESVNNPLARNESAVNATLSVPVATLGMGSVIISSKDGMKMTYAPAGEFMMGGDVYYDEKPIHTVNLKSFWIDQTEVTNAMFAAFLTEEGNRAESAVTWLDSQDKDAHIQLEEDSWQADDGYEDHPVVEVTWYGAHAYCRWAGRRLPTEAEWEKAARWRPSQDGSGQDKGEAFTYPWGNNNPSAHVLNFNDSIGDTTKIGSYPNGASPFGALDMAGNVWEWVADRYSRTYYASSPTDNPMGPDTGFFRVLRGGAWNYRETYARSMHRNRGVPIISHDFIGFRCASDALP